MPWTALFQRADAQAHGWIVTIVCTDGTVREGRTTTLHALNNQTVQAFAREAIKEIEDQKVAPSQLTYVKDAVIDLTDPGPPADPDPQLTDYRVSKSKVESMQRALDLGILPASSNAALNSLKSATQAKWLDRFAGLV